MKPSVPSSDSLWNLSSGYRDAGDAALDLVRTETYSGFVVFPCVFSYFRCIELALKAILVDHAVTEQEITRTLGHRISKLMTKVESFTLVSALGIGEDDRRLLDRFSSDYSDKWFEYPDDFWRAIPELEKLKELAHRICDATQFYGRTSA